MDNEAAGASLAAKQSSTQSTGPAMACDSSASSSAVAPDTASTPQPAQGLPAGNLPAAVAAATEDSAPSLHAVPHGRGRMTRQASAGCFVMQRTPAAVPSDQGEMLLTRVPLPGVADKNGAPNCTLLL